jgi:phage/plasmid-associated DNA primase
MLLTGIRKGQSDKMKHCICIDVDNPKKREINGSKFIRDNEDLFDNCYVETSGNGGKHYIFLLDPKKYTEDVRNNDNERFVYNDKTYSIDVLVNSRKCVLAPSKYEGPRGIKEYTTDNSFDDIGFISDKLLKMCGVSEKKLIKPIGKQLKNSKGKKLSSTVETDKYKIDDTDNDNSIHIKAMLRNNVFDKIDGYPNWILIGMVIKNEKIVNGFELFHSISKQYHSGYKSEDDCKKYFGKIGRFDENKKIIKMGTLVNLVKNTLTGKDYERVRKDYMMLLSKAKESREEPEEELVDESDGRQLLTGPFTDVDISEYMKSLYGDNFASFGDFIYYWTGNYWIKDTTVDSINKVISFDLFNNLKKIADKCWNTSNEEKLKTYQKVLKKLIKLRNNNTKKGIIEEFKAAVKLEKDMFDLNPDMLGFKNGTYDLKNMVFRDARKDDYISLIINYDYRVSTDDEMKKFMNFIDTVMPVPEERDFLLKALSSGLGGRTLENILILTGSGRNGKDTLLSYLMKEALDRNLFYYNNNTVITGNNSSGVNQEKCNMDKKRCVLFSEPNKDCNLKNNTLKEISGCKQINARGLYSKNTETILHATNIILCNKIPTLDNVDEAISQRLLVIPFRSLFRKLEDIKKLPEGTKYVYEVNSYYKEAEFIHENKLPFINLLLTYYSQFKADGYILRNPPKSIVELSSAYMCESDDFLNWFNEQFEKTDQVTDCVKMIDLYEYFRCSDLYTNMTKKEKRTMNRKKLTDEIASNPNLRTHYRERVKIKGIDYRCVIIGYKIIANDCLDDAYE